MLDKQNIIVEYLEAPASNKGVVFQVAHEVYLKMVDYLRLTQAKNTFNRLSDYHYLNIAVSNSTEPIRGIDYIQPVVAPGVDYATAVVTKCLMPSGKIEFEFERFSEQDDQQARQSTEMVKYMLNSKNDSYQVIRDWAQDALLHKNGIVMVSPVREPIVQYKRLKAQKTSCECLRLWPQKRVWKPSARTCVVLTLIWKAWPETWKKVLKMLLKPSTPTTSIAPNTNLLVTAQRCVLSILLNTTLFLS